MPKRELLVQNFSSSVSDSHSSLFVLSGYITSPKAVLNCVGSEVGVQSRKRVICRHTQSAEIASRLVHFADGLAAFDEEHFNFQFCSLCLEEGFIGQLS